MRAGRTLRQSIGPLALASALGLASFVGPAKADVLFNNLGFAGTGSDPVSSVLFDSFSTGAQGVALTSLSFQLSASNPADAGQVGVALFSDQGGAPNTVLRRLGVIADSSLSTTPSILQLAGFTPIALSADTRYWVRLAQLGSTASSAVWLYDNSSRGTGVATQFSLNTTNVQGVTSNLSGASVYLMGSTAVPEPGSIALLMVGLVGAGLSVSRRKSAGAAVGL